MDRQSGNDYVVIGKEEFDGRQALSHRVQGRLRVADLANERLIHHMSKLKGPCVQRVGHHAQRFY